MTMSQKEATALPPPKTNLPSFWKNRRPLMCLKKFSPPFDAIDLNCTKKLK